VLSLVASLWFEFQRGCKLPSFIQRLFRSKADDQQFYWSSVVFGVVLCGTSYFSVGLTSTGSVSTEMAAYSVLTLQAVWLAMTVVCVSVPLIWFLATLPSAFIECFVLLQEGVVSNDIAAAVLSCTYLLHAFFMLRSNRRLHEGLIRDQASQHLIDELQQAKVQAEQLRRLAEEANRAKSRFLASASHDLRQPLTALSLYSEALNQIAKGAAIKDVAEHIDASVRHLEDLFNSLLDLSKLDAGVVQVNPTIHSVFELLNRLAVEYAEQASHRNIALSSKGSDCWINADPILFERVIRNLLENALRYTSEGRVDLNCYRTGYSVCVEVSDTGAGIPQSERERIFDEYYQISNPGRDRSKGLGIGLSIVRKLLELMGLEVMLESAVGKGSVFKVIAPAVEQPQLLSVHADDLVVPKDEGLVGRKVLLIDDDVEILAAAAMMLRLQGCLVVTASNRVEAMESFGNEMPDVVVADYRLADGENGLHVLDALKNRFPALKGMVLTGDTGPGPLKEVLASGYRIVHKPVRANELILQLRGLLGLGAAPVPALSIPTLEQRRAPYYVN
jgi:two-component system, sensor histidine kinase